MKNSIKNWFFIIVFAAILTVFLAIGQTASAADQLPYSDGALIKGSTPEVYLISNGLKRWIINEKTFNDLQFNWEKIVTISDETLNQYPTGQEIKSGNSYPDGVLIKGSTPEVYLIENGKRRWIPNETTFIALNLNWQNIFTIDDEKLEGLSRGNKISPLNYTPSRPETNLTKMPAQTIEQTNIRFEFIAKSTDPSQITFETFLTGADKDWVSTGSRQYRDFNLPAKTTDYTFFVRSRTKDGQIDPTPTRYQFTIKISPYYQQVKISGGNIRSSDYKNETVEIYNRANYPVNVTGWTVSSEKKKNSYGLTPAYLIPAYADLEYLVNLELIPGQKIMLFTQPSPLGRSRLTKAPYGFRLNKCVGYLNPSYKFAPALPNQCPKIELSDEEKDYLNADCEEVIKNLNSCRQPNSEELKRCNANCQAFLRERVSYESCVNRHRYDTDFYQNHWYLYLNHTAEVWSNSNETLILRDVNGLVVDRYEY